MTGSMRPALAFAASFAIALPAGWHWLGAGPPGVPGARPPIPSVQVGKLRVELTVDKSEVELGGELTVHLAAFGTGETQPGPRPSETDGEVSVSILQVVTQQMGRNPMPAVLMGETRQVHVAPGRPTELHFKVGARPADPVALAGSAQSYTILVTPTAKPGAAAPPPARGVIGPNQAPNLEDQVQLGGIGSLGRRALFPKNAAMAQVVARVPPAFALTLEPPGPLVAGKQADCVLKVKNLTDKQLTGLALMIYGADFDGLDAPARLATLEPGREASVRVKLRAHKTTRATSISATGYARYGGSAAIQVEVDAQGQLAVREVSSLAFLQ